MEEKMNGDYKAFCGYIVLSIIAWLHSLLIYRNKHSGLQRKEKAFIVISVVLFAAAIFSIVLKWDPIWAFIEGGCILVLAIWFNASIRNKN
jgi:hypothetical protein